MPLELNQQEENLSKEERQERVYNLTLEARELELKLKSVSGTLREELKRVKKEIKSLTQKDVHLHEVY